MMEDTPGHDVHPDAEPVTGHAVTVEPFGNSTPSDWNPRSPTVHRDPVAAYDEMRSRCPVARDADGAWTLFSHRDVMGAALDHRTFSNAVSRHVQVPNGLDGAPHTAFRALVERYFSPERMSVLEPVVHGVAARMVGQLEIPGPMEAVEVGSRFAVRAQTAWLGWPTCLEEDLLQWMQDNHAATRSGDRLGTAKVAQRFDAIMQSLIDARRAAGNDAPDDVTSELLAARVDGRELTDQEVISILRNWTGGDLGSMALCAGVILSYLADHPDVQNRLRDGVPDREFDAILDEILRIDDPFVMNRRITTEPVTVGGRTFASGERVVLNWTAANRDPRVFGDPEAFDPAGNAPYNLVYGIGKHVCPGRPLATMELRELTRAVLRATVAIESDQDHARERELPPVGGFAAVPLILR